MHKPTLLQEPSLLFCKQQLVMSLSNPQCVVGWFSVNYSTSKDTAYGGEDLIFWMHVFLLHLYIYFFDSPVIFVLYVQTNTSLTHL